MKRVLGWLATLVVVSAVAGCVRFPEPNDEPAPGDPGPGATTQAPETGPGSGAIHTVQFGDNVFTLAERYRVPLRTLIDINRLQPPYRLIPGQPLFIPKPREHRVAQGDTVYAISRRYRVDMSALVKLNDIVPPYTIHVGQVLRIPAPVENEATLAAATCTRASRSSKPAGELCPRGTATERRARRRTGRGRGRRSWPAISRNRSTAFLKPSWRSAGAHFRPWRLTGHSNDQAGDAGGRRRP